MNTRLGFGTPHPRARVRGLLATLLWLALPGQGQGAPPIAPPAPVPEETLLAPRPAAHATLASLDGDTLTVLRTRYEDGTEVEHPVQVALAGFPLSLDVVLLEPIVPAPRVVRVPAGEGLAAQATRVGRTLAFAPGVPFRVRVRQVPGFATPEVLLEGKDRALAEAPSCLKEEWLGLARLRTDPGTRMLVGSLDTGDPVGSRKAQTLSPSSAPGTPYFAHGEFVCVSFREAAQAP